MSFKHLIDFNDLSLNDWEELYNLGLDIKTNEINYKDFCKNKILATLFYEPSTRTMLSFEAAMLRLGGNVIGFNNPSNSSVSKGENLKDTIRIITNYADIAVIRHPLEGAALAASLYSSKPIINAGDGGHSHPTQTLADLFTIKNTKGSLDNLTIGICGDLKNGRTVHSLLKAMSSFKDNTFYLISTPELKTPKYLTDMLTEKGNNFYAVSSIEECIGKLDVLYMTRIQKERFSNIEQYEKQKNVYILDQEKLDLAKDDLIILHPLPKVDEIDQDIDFDKRALYFIQAKNGMYMRMALIIKMLQTELPPVSRPTNDSENIKCPNSKCITHTEKYLPTKLYSSNDRNTSYSCLYCDYHVN
ncbi:MAG: aspartate carbamoyltransferase [Clostridia bacterium]